MNARPLALFGLLLGLVLSGPAPAHREPLHDEAAHSALARSERVAFNTSSRKYHCQSCRWAKACTRNCILVPRDEAVRRGGVPCKVCGGRCRGAAG